jgi:hypothetical protein
VLQVGSPASRLGCQTWWTSPRGTTVSTGVTGFNAGPGYDLASGWGTINAARFVPALALTASH